MTELDEIRGRLSNGDYVGAAALARDAIAMAQAAEDAAALETLGRELYDLVVVDASTGADELRRASDEALSAAAVLPGTAARPPASSGAGAAAFEDLAGRARFAVVGLAVTMTVSVLAIGADAWEISLLTRMIRGGGPPGIFDDLAASDNRQAVVGLLEVAALIGCAIVFIRWFAPAYRNLRALGAPDLRFGPGWAIGAWFVPVLNLWRPKQIANDIWRGSDPEAPARLAGELQLRPVATVVTGWWAAWVLTGVLGNFVGRAWFDSNTPQSLRSAASWDIVAELTGILAAGLAIAFVRQVTTMQALRHARLTDTA